MSIKYQNDYIFAFILQNLKIKKYKGGYYHLPSVPCAYFAVIVSGLSDENMNFKLSFGGIFATLKDEMWR